MAGGQQPSKNITAYLLLTIAPLCWAGNIVLAKGVVELIPPVAFAFWRWTAAFCILLPFAWRHVKKDWKTSVQHLNIMILISLSGITAFNTLLYTAVHTTTAVNGALIQTAMPAVIILLTLLLFKEGINRLQFTGVFLCIAGAVLVVLRGRLDTLTSMTFVRGDLLMIVATTCYALYSTLLRKRPAIHPLSFLVITFGLGATGLSPVYLWELTAKGGFVLDANVALSILYVATFPSIVAYFCWNRGIDLIGPNRGGLFINLIPVFASVMAVFFLGESFQMFHGISMAMIVGGMIIFNR